MRGRGEQMGGEPHERDIDSLMIEEVLGELNSYNNVFDYMLGSSATIEVEKGANKLAWKRLTDMDSSDNPFADQTERELLLKIIQDSGMAITEAEQLLADIGQAISQDGANIPARDIQHFLDRYRCDLDIRPAELSDEEQMWLRRFLSMVRKAIEILRRKYDDTQIGIRVVTKTHYDDPEPEITW